MWECKIPYFLAQLTTGTGPLKKNALKWGSFLQKRRKKSFFSFLFGLCTYIEKKLQKRSLFSCTIGWGLQQKKRIYASTKVNIKRKVKICLQQGQRPGILFLKLFWSTVGKICFCDKKKLKVAWNLFEIPRIIYLNSAAVRSFLIQNFFLNLFNIAGCVSDLIHWFIRMRIQISQWCCNMVDGAEFWISCRDAGTEIARVAQILAIS